MIIKLNTNLVPMFSGTYETIWQVTEYNDNSEELEIDYKLQDLLKSIAGSYQDNAEYILSELNCNFIKKLTFDGTFYSPREYNFSTDTLDFTIEVNKKELLKTLAGLKYNEEFETFLHDHYTSYDGFMSWTPNNYRDIAESIKTHGDDFDQSIGALIRFLANAKRDSSLYDDPARESIEMEVFEDWSGNGYNGLDYKIIDPKE